MALKDIVAQTVTGLGYDLVEVQRSSRGLLCVTIDWPWLKPMPELSPAPVQQFISVEDCEKVTRQLQFVLEVENIEYKRLEVSSPGVDRLLRHAQDFERFLGWTIDITLNEPIGANAGSQVHVNRKKFRGQLELAVPNSQQSQLTQWRLVWRDEPKLKPGARLSKKRPPAPLQSLVFRLDELSSARLAPVLDFKGRSAGQLAAGGEELKSD